MKERKKQRDKINIDLHYAHTDKENRKKIDEKRLVTTHCRKGNKSPVETPVKLRINM